MTSTSSTRSKTAADILDIFNADVTRYFDQEDDELDPYVVCDGVSVDAFNEYIGDGEGLRIGLRFMWLSDDGRIMIVDLPTLVHECTADSFKKLFNHAVGNASEWGNALPNKEADATFGPKESTPPAPRTGIADLVTLAVEIGRSQTWASLEQAVRWWLGYPGIEYVLLLKISARAQQMRYALYDSSTDAIIPTASDTFRRRANGAAVNVTFDMRRILAMPANVALRTQSLLSTCAPLWMKSSRALHKNSFEIVEES
ncbi:Hypothetical protein PHPALM_18497 [Phytophthora palmivora]|uniref:Uncharacterized protein n=1 Tax=Phytophthora palmivora TaxID=4796 RepID=A0A2P4XJL2_9STRA|nr:Hypothetical protein PHPALM_18497 [Phytophthora palmivora]